MDLTVVQAELCGRLARRSDITHVRVLVAPEPASGARGASRLVVLWSAGEMGEARLEWQHVITAAEQAQLRAAKTAAVTEALYDLWQDHWDGYRTQWWGGAPPSV